MIWTIRAIIDKPLGNRHRDRRPEQPDNTHWPRLLRLPAHRNDDGDGCDSRPLWNDIDIIKLSMQWIGWHDCGWLCCVDCALRINVLNILTVLGISWICALLKCDGPTYNQFNTNPNLLTIIGWRSGHFNKKLWNRREETQSQWDSAGRVKRWKAKSRAEGRTIWGIW